MHTVAGVTVGIAGGGVAATHAVCVVGITVAAAAGGVIAAVAAAAFDSAAFTRC